MDSWRIDIESITVCSLFKGTHNKFFLLAGHKVDFIAPCRANKSTFWPASRKKIVCNTGKTFIFPSCTMYYCVQTGGKSRIACLRVERHAANCASATQSGEMFIPPAPTGENVHSACFNGRNVHRARLNGENVYTAWHLTARG